MLPAGYGSTSFDEFSNWGAEQSYSLTTRQIPTRGGVFPAFAHTELRLVMSCD